MEVRQELLFNMTAAYNYDESKEKCSWSCLLGIECGFLSFPWETTRLWAGRATERTAIGLALIIGARSRGTSPRLVSNLPWAEKRAACSATENKCLLAGDEFRNPFTDGVNVNRDDSRENDILKY